MRKEIDSEHDITSTPQAELLEAALGRLNTTTLGCSRLLLPDAAWVLPLLVVGRVEFEKQLGRAVC